MTATIRLGLKADIDIILSIIRNVIKKMRSENIDQWDEQYPGLSEIITDIENENLFVVEESGNLVGFVSMDRKQPDEYGDASWLKDGTALIVHRLAISPSHQGVGYGSMLMGFIECIASEKKFSSIRLDAFSQNPAVCSLYLSKGYKQVGRVTFRKGEFYCFEKAVE